MTLTHRKYRLVSIGWILHCIIISTPHTLALQGRPALSLSLRRETFKIPSAYHENILFRSKRLHSQGVEEDYRLLSTNENEPTSHSRPLWLSQSRWSQALRVDRNQMAELGVSFMLTYNLVSNINGSIFLSLAWYISSIRVRSFFKH